MNRLNRVSLQTDFLWCCILDSLSGTVQTAEAVIHRKQGVMLTKLSHTIFKCGNDSRYLVIHPTTFLHYAAFLTEKYVTFIKLECYNIKCTYKGI